jgi:tRNA U38,U39,U40 pseudouridine synthase TruA
VIDFIVTRARTTFVTLRSKLTHSQNMVRIITGTPVEVGWANVCRKTYPELALAGGDRTKSAGVTAPAMGLTMVRVDY